MTTDPASGPGGPPRVAAPSRLVLALDAATATGTAALLLGEVVRAECEVAMRGEDEERLMPAVAGMMADAGVGVSDLAAIVCGEGPGSFTSLRIAASIAKGLSLSAGIPLYAVSSLALIVAGASRTLAPGRYLAALDAMRGDLFVSEVILHRSESVELVGGAVLMSAAAAAERARASGVPLVGPGGAIVERPRARGAGRVMGALPGAAWGAEPVHLSAWEPAYGRLAEAQVKWEATHGRPLSGG